MTKYGWFNLILFILMIGVIVASVAHDRDQRKCDITSAAPCPLPDRSLDHVR